MTGRRIIPGKNLRSFRVRCLVVTTTLRQAVLIQWLLDRSWAGQAAEDRSPSDRRLLRCDVVVGTPASLLLMMREGSLQVSAVERIVFDDCDRLLDDGFIGALRKLARPLPLGFRSVLLSLRSPCAAHQRLAALMYGPAILDVSDPNGATPLWIVVQVGSSDAAEVVRNVLSGDGCQIHA